MKAAAFDYVRAHTVTDALALLARHGESAKLVSGGQSLLPALNLRLMAPGILIDIAHIGELRGITVAGDVLRLGALTRHVDLQTSSDVALHAPLLTEAIGHVAHPAIRNRGTLGGNLAHADPASELPACLMALGATVRVIGARGERRMAARDFFTGVYATALEPGEILIGVDLPVRAPNGVQAFEELSRRSGDYAIVGLACAGQIATQISGAQLTALRLAYFAVGDHATLAAKASAALLNRPITADVIATAQVALADDLDPHNDPQATAAMRLHLARVLLARAIPKLLGASSPGLNNAGLKTA
jgi:aerobic carbon-monoxide dehydrogenase medium subunit